MCIKEKKKKKEKQVAQGQRIGLQLVRAKVRVLPLQIPQVHMNTCVEKNVLSSFWIFFFFFLLLKKIITPSPSSILFFVFLSCVF